MYIRQNTRALKARIDEHTSAWKNTNLDRFSYFAKHLFEFNHSFTPQANVTLLHESSRYDILQNLKKSKNVRNVKEYVGRSETGRIPSFTPCIGSGTRKSETPSEARCESSYICRRILSFPPLSEVSWDFENIRAFPSCRLRVLEKFRVSPPV